MAANESGGFSDCMPPPMEVAVAEEVGGEFVEDDYLTMDLDQFMYILDDDQESGHVQFQNIPEETQHCSPEELSARSFLQVECPPIANFDKNSDLQRSAASSGVERPQHFIDSAGNSVDPDPSAQVRDQSEASTSCKEWHSMGSGSDDCFIERAVHHPNYNMQGCSAVSSHANESTYQVTDCKDRMDPSWSNYDTEVQCGYMNSEIDLKSSEVVSQCHITEHSNVEFGQYGDFSRICMGTSGGFKNSSYKSVEMSFLDADASRNAASIESVCQSPDGAGDWHSNNMVRQCSDKSPDLNSSGDQNHFNTCLKTLHSDGGMIMNVNRIGDFQNESASCSSRISSNARENRVDAKGQRLLYNRGNYTSQIRGNYCSDADRMSFNKAVPAGSLMCSKSYIPGRGKRAPEKAAMQNSLLTHLDTVHRFANTPEIAKFVASTYDVNESVITDCKTTQDSSIPQSLRAFVEEYQSLISACKKARHSYALFNEYTGSSFDNCHMDAKASGPYMPFYPHSVLSKPEFTKKESRSPMNQIDCFVDDSSLSPEYFNPDTSGCHVKGDGDSDVCILDEASCPVGSPRSVAPRNSLVTSWHAMSSDSYFSSQHSTISRAVGNSGIGGLQPKANDERLVFRVALQDLAQPRSEASPPEGLLAVPLLRHQKIALAWMIQKETNSLPCSGGILADDQGLGKTISTIALILKERPSSSRVFQEDMQQDVLETLNLDEDDDSFLDKEKKLECTNNNLIQLKGRPAAGTLVVCPTSVLRQWAKELQSKVTSKAKLSVLVYHGSHRTKDPSELAKYDIVLTTYSIVSMEVPKQPICDKDDQEKKDREGVAQTSSSASASNSSNRKSSKKSKEKNSKLLESLARPLAKVGWFRVILDEAQSIKNHKTQVARSCWGLRAKRRWCLSGTPIQNTIDDLYSYFRFLRYDPYSVYKTFCDTIKFPISKTPMRGYRKLQAVLKTIMLRRTKGTFLDGKPIITLPPKFVELKKVEFTWKERDFYSRLEADSRAQFAEYAAAGTVKQNYVNILLMLLRLRQACDHPLLVRKYNLGSAWKSSVEVLKKLPQERRQFLLNCLEGSMAICGICKDPPEDAIVSICGHVFCNQCICDHLTMDDRKCPATNCKDKLSESSVFSKVTLINSLSVLSGQDGLLGCPDAELADGVGPFFEDGLYESSKIKEAIEVLQALRPQICAPICNSDLDFSDGYMSCLENSSNDQPKMFSNDASKDQNLNCPVKVMGEKAIVFSQWTRMLDLLEACLKKSLIQYRRLDGTMSVAARDKAVNDFNTIPEVSVMIMSLKAASLGLNMVAACHVILLDLWWNPTTEDQAVDRAHRIGQTRPVKVLRLTVKDTVEDRILALQGKKREMVASAFGEDETGNSQNRLTVEDLNYLFMA